MNTATAIAAPTYSVQALSGRLVVSWTLTGTISNRWIEIAVEDSNDAIEARAVAPASAAGSVTVYGLANNEDYDIVGRIFHATNGRDTVTDIMDDVALDRELDIVSIAENTGDATPAGDLDAETFVGVTYTGIPSRYDVTLCLCQSWVPWERHARRGVGFKVVGSARVCRWRI